ncbi:MAG TPA: aldehyde dehydrogenase family protein [Polyangiaceae bacterium]|nr:aldehyde dehydrogenase family protein [Polyangiaceae bacterium]
MVRQLEVRSPYDRALVDTLPWDDDASLEGKLSRAASFATPSRVLPKHERLALLGRVATLIDERREELARLAASEGGKPLVDSRVELVRAAEGARAAQAVLHRDHGSEVPMGLSAASTGRFAVTMHEPLGLVGAISAFNHPFNLAVHQLIPAVAAGCPVLIKPARATPLSCRALLSILRDAGLEPGRADMLVLENEAAERFASDSRLAFFSFIGSAEVGFRLQRRLAPGVGVALEHGGVAPVVLHESADLAAVVPRLVKGGYYHAGQVCVSVQRVYVPRSRLDELLAELVPRVSSLRVGDPLDATTEVGPLIRESEVARVASWVEEAARSGSVLVGGKALSASCYEPTLLVAPADDARISREEVFGPVVAVYPYDSWDEAIERANAVDVCFQAAVFARDLDAAWDGVRRLRATAVMVNDHTAFRVDWMPFGGRGRSGVGLGGIEDSMRDLTAQKLVVFQSPNL